MEQVERVWRRGIEDGKGELRVSRWKKGKWWEVGSLRKDVMSDTDATMPAWSPDARILDLSSLWRSLSENLQPWCRTIDLRWGLVCKDCSYRDWRIEPAFKQSYFGSRGSQFSMIVWNLALKPSPRYLKSSHAQAVSRQMTFSLGRKSETIVKKSRMKYKPMPSTTPSIHTAECPTNRE